VVCFAVLDAAGVLALLAIAACALLRVTA